MKIHCIVIFFLTATILLVTAGRKLFNRNDRQRNLDFREVGTTEHNRYRSNHHSPKLVYDRNLALKAYDCTVSLIENMTNGPSCGTYKTIGENVHISNRGDLPDTPWGRAEAVHDAIHSWYLENLIYHYEKPTESQVYLTRHFTQIVWKNTTSLGLCVGRREKGKIVTMFVVALYRPKGNIADQSQPDKFHFYRENVLPDFSVMDDADRSRRSGTLLFVWLSLQIFVSWNHLFLI